VTQIILWGKVMTDKLDIPMTVAMIIIILLTIALSIVVFKWNQTIIDYRTEAIAECVAYNLNNTNNLCLV
jgi:hypothetical protein